MAEFDAAAFARAQRQIESSARRVAAQDAKNRRSKSAGGGSKIRRGGGTAARATRGQSSWTSAGRTPPLVLKVHTGGQAGDAYAERQDGASLIDTNMLGQTAAERQAEFHLDTLKHPRVNPKNVFQHVSLSRPAGQDLSDEQWKKVARRFLKEIGADGVQYSVIRHQNTSNDHCHLIFSRSLPNGKLLSLSHQRWAWRAALRQVEADLNITAAERPVDAERPTCSTSDAQVNAARRATRRGTPPSYIDPAVIARVLAQACTPEQFASGLKAAGVQAKPAKSNDKTTGILFQKIGTEEWLAGSSISREFSLPKIQAQIELNRRALLKKEQELVMQRQRDAIDLQRQQAQVHYPRERN